MSGSKGIGGASQTNTGQLVGQTETHGRFGKYRIAIGAAVALPVIAAAITIGGLGAIVAGGIAVAVGASLILAGICKGLTQRNAETLQMQPVFDPATTTLITIDPDENYASITQGAIDLVLGHPGNVATCMMDDGTTKRDLDQNGELSSKETPNKDTIQSINRAKNLDDGTILNLITKGQASSEITSTQAWKDFLRECRTFNIYGTELTYHDPKVEGAGNESYAGFMQRVADEIKQYEIQKLNKQSEDLTYEELKQIQDKQIKFFRQLLKYPGQALSGGTTFPIFSSYYLNHAQTPPIKDNYLTHYTVSLLDDDTISVETIHIFAALPNADTNQETLILLKDRQCIEEKITATISLSEGTQKNDSKFTTKESKISLFVADATVEPTSSGYALFVNTSSAKTVLEMTYTGTQDDQPPTFTIKQLDQNTGSIRDVETLRLINDKWIEQTTVVKPGDVPGEDTGDRQNSHPTSQSVIQNIPIPQPTANTSIPQQQPMPPSVPSSQQQQPTTSDMPTIPIPTGLNDDTKQFATEVAKATKYNMEPIHQIMSDDGQQILNLMQDTDGHCTLSNEPNQPIKDDIAAIKAHQKDSEIDNFIKYPTIENLDKIGTQSTKDFYRNITEFEIFGQTVSRSQYDTYNDFLAAVFQEIDEHLSGQSEDKKTQYKHNFVSSLLKYPVQAVQGTPLYIYLATTGNINLANTNPDNPIMLHEVTKNNVPSVKIILTDDKIEAQSTCYCLISRQLLPEKQEQQLVLLGQARMSIDMNDENATFTMNTNAISCFAAPVTPNTNTTIVSIDESQKIEIFSLKYDRENGQNTQLILPSTQPTETGNDSLI